MPEHPVVSLCEREQDSEQVLTWHRGHVYFAASELQVAHKVAV